jgi:hypothetical protein
MNFVSEQLRGKSNSCIHFILLGKPMDKEDLPFPERPDDDENDDGEYSVAGAFAKAIVN